MDCNVRLVPYRKLCLDRFIECTDNCQVVPYESAQIGHAKHETVSSIHGNHLEICKFATSTDDGYKAVFDAIEDYLDIVTKETCMWMWS